MEQFAFQQPPKSFNCIPVFAGMHLADALVKIKVGFTFFWHIQNKILISCCLWNITFAYILETDFRDLLVCYLIGRVTGWKELKRSSSKEQVDDTCSGGLWVVTAEPFSHGTRTLQCLQKEMATYRHWSVSLWRDPDDVPHCRILSPDKTEWRLISATLCGWRCYFVADQLWLMTRIREEEDCYYLEP